ncbi:MAG: ABC transporter permease, partial [Acidobacteriota bacterium]
MLKQRDDQDFFDEIEAHLQLEADQLIEEGMDPDQAMLAARRKFGNVTRSQERFYESNHWMWLDHLIRNTRYALRQMRAAPASTAAILLSLALGVGLNTSIFSLADQALFRPLPVTDPESLVQLRWDGRFVVAGMGNVGYGHLLPFPLFRQMQRESEVLEQVFARVGTPVHLGARESPRPAQAELVTGDFFAALGVRPAFGALLGPSEDVQQDAHPQVVLSYAFWQSHFGGDPGVVGERILVDNFPMTVIGVAQAGFHGMDRGRPAALWLPMMMKARVTAGWTGFEEHRARFAQVYARLPAGLSRRQAEMQLAPWFEAYLQADVQRADWPSVT